MRYRLTPWWLRVVAVFALSRVVTTTILLVAASLQDANPWTGARPGYLDFATMWDGHWYYIIAVSAYPSELPIDAEGHIGENAWAFMPVYPMLVRALMLITGGSFALLAVVVSVVAALGAALLFFRLMRDVLPREAVMFSVVVFCFGPLSPILQVAYAESLHLLLLVLGLWLLVRRNYWMLLPVVLVMSLTRPSGLAFGLLLLLHLIARFLTRGRDPFPVRERVAVVVVGLWTAFCGLAWLLAAALGTGSLTAYTDTELAWRSVYIGRGELVPFTSWFESGEWWFWFLGVPREIAGWMGALAVVLLVAIFALVMISAPVRRLGTDLRLWLLSYALYLLAVFFPQSSTFRLLVPMFPLAGALAIPRSPVYRVTLVVVMVALQVWWVDIGWRVDGADWTPP